MDPYPGEYNNDCYASGLSFSVNRNIPINKIPKSLNNIFIELKNEYPNITMTNGDLTSWALQGVLMINASLTVRPGVPGSHKFLWRGFIKEVLNELNNRSNTDQLVVMCWGRDAETLLPFVSTKAQILKAGHPSPQSFHLFKGCNHFLKTNAFFKHIGQQPIDFGTYP